MRQLVELRAEIRFLQRRIADGTYEQNGLTKVVNRLNVLKQRELDIVNSKGYERSIGK